MIFFAILFSLDFPNSTLRANDNEQAVLRKIKTVKGRGPKRQNQEMHASILWKCFSSDFSMRFTFS